MACLLMKLARDQVSVKTKTQRKHYQPPQLVTLITYITLDTEYLLHPK